MKKDQKNCVLHGDKTSEVFYLKSSEHNLSKEGILIWNLFMNTDLEEAFGVFNKLFTKKKNYQ